MSASRPGGDGLWPKLGWSEQPAWWRNNSGLSSEPQALIAICLLDISPWMTLRHLHLINLFHPYSSLPLLNKQFHHSAYGPSRKHGRHPWVFLFLGLAPSLIPIKSRQLYLQHNTRRGLLLCISTPTSLEQNIVIFCLDCSSILTLLQDTTCFFPEAFSLHRATRVSFKKDKSDGITWHFGTLHGFPWYLE